MQLGFVSAVFPDLSLQEVAHFAAFEGFSCVELMCWPPGKAERRYAGVTHVDVVGLDASRAAAIQELIAKAGIRISSLGYYPNPLSSDPSEVDVATRHLRRVILAAEVLEVRTVTTFIGRDPDKSIDAEWPRFLEVWRPLVQFAEDHGVRIGIENCPMLYTADEWPGGKNLAYCPAVWRRMFDDIPNPNFGLNYDPSHLVWQQIDHIEPLNEFADRIVHVHFKDAQVDRSRLNDVGILATPLEYHRPVLPGRGDVDWRRFLAALRKIGYQGPACIEVEDREFEGSLAARQDALRRSAAFLRPLLEEVSP